MLLSVMIFSHYCYLQANNTLPCNISVWSRLSYLLIMLTNMDFGFLQIELILLFSGNYLTTAIVSGFSGRVGLLVGDIRRVDLIEMGEEHSGWGKPFEICPDVLVHLVKLFDLCWEFRAVAQACRRVVDWLRVIQVVVARDRTSLQSYMIITR